MSQPVICSGCRLKLAIRARTAARHAPVIYKRSISRSPRPHQISHDQNELPRRYGRYSRPHGTDEPLQAQRYQDAKEPSTERQARPSETRARYSGQALRPEQLLGQLDGYESRRPARSKRLNAEDADPYTAQSRDKDASLHDRSARGDAPNRERCETLLNSFVQAVDGKRIPVAWTALLTMKNSMTQDEIRKTCGSVFHLRLRQLMRRIDRAYLKRLQAATADGHQTSRIQLPSPWEFAKLAKSMGCLANWIRAEMLWRLGKGLIASRTHEEYHLPQESEASLCSQIVLLWHDTLGVRLWQDGAHGPNTAADNIDSLNWSGLPPPYIIAPNEQGSKTTLPDVFSKIVPLWRSKDEAVADVDYQSAMFVTLDALTGGANLSPPKLEPGETAPGVVSGAIALVKFFDDLLKLVSKPKVPDTLQYHLQVTEDPMLAYYEGLVRRYEMKEIPPVRTERGRLTVGILKGKTSALGTTQVRREDPSDRTTDPKQTASTSIKHDLGQEQVTDTHEKDEDDAERPAALDKASLLEAGFSVTESYDMSPEVHRQVDIWLKRLGRSIEQTNLSSAEACWKEVNAFNAANSGTSSLPLYLYEHFMLAFLAMRQPRLAVETWNMVSKVGLRPTVRTWTVMMRGCARAGDVLTLETFWTRMRAHNVQPDHYAWSVRVTGLIAENRVEAALAALDEMGQEWMAAIRGDQHTQTGKAKHGKAKPATAAETMPNISDHPDDVNGVPRPSLIIMNSAVTALARKADTHIPKVLSWGRIFNITPDLTTYNALLNVAMRHSQPAEALAIFRRMQDRGIPPNSTTFTVLLTALFQSGFLDNLSPDQQTERLLSLITQIETASPDACMDAKAYALAIDRMLKIHTNAPAARALLEHMAAHNIEPTPHIYTILMASYFASSPPDFTAAEALWHRIQNASSGYGAPVDVIFYDRMVESYAQHHAAVGMGPMLMFLDRMSKEGKRPSWKALECVARALAERGDWARLRALVGDLINLKGSVRLGARGLVGQREFWGFVVGAGVVRAQEIREGAVMIRGASSWRGEGGGQDVV